jgi:hypothetical protein
MNKISNISLGMTAVALAGMAFLPNILSASAQNVTGSMDVESVKSLLDEAKGAMDNGNNKDALVLLDQVEDRLDIFEDSLEKSLGIRD